MKYKIHIILTATIFMVAVNALSQNKSAGINISAWNKVATQSNDSSQTSYFNLGLYSSMNQLNGIGLNIIASTVNKNVNGIQISSIANTAKGSMRGLQIAGITNINGNKMAGVSVSGLTNIIGHDAYGVAISGMINIIGSQSSALTIAGLMNISGDNTSGVHISGLSNLSSSTFNGVMIGGLLNIGGKDFNGVQVSALANIVASEMRGLQIGIANYTTTGKGVQLGIVNYYREQFDGLQLGIVNINPDTKTQMMLYGGNNTKFNVAVRFKNQLFYNIIGAGLYPYEIKKGFSGALQYRAGMWKQLYKNLSLSGDLGYQHIEGFKANDCPSRLYSLQARLNLEYQLTSRFGLFATGGYGINRFYNKNATFEKKPIFEAGIILF